MSFVQTEELYGNIELFIQLIGSGILGVAITLSTLLVVTICSPLALNVSGNIKNAISAFISFLVFDDLMVSYTVISGISIGFMASCIQMYDELKINSLKPKQ